MIYGSVCSGIEAATVAWHPLEWKPAWFSEIEKFPSAVLEHHYPHIENRGDMTKFKEWNNGAIDLLVGGTPCQSYSVAGLRKGLADPRGNLMLTFGSIAAKYRPTWLVWENVPGVLSSNGGRDFGTFLGMLAELGYGFAYRVLDAQYFGLAQRRKRVFVIGHIGDWRRAAAVLFERHSLSGDITPSREKRETAPTIPARSTGGGGLGTGFDCDGGLTVQPYKVANCLTARTARTARTAKGVNSTLDEGQTPIIVHGTQDPGTSEVAFALGRNSGQENAVFSLHENQRGELSLNETAGTIKTQGGKPRQGYQAVLSVAIRGREDGGTAELSGEVATALRASTGGGDKPHVLASSMVRRLTPIECERLQGFPDNYTQIPWRGKDQSHCPDGPRYKALGNSMAVPVMRWIGERIKMVEAMRAVA